MMPTCYFEMEEAGSKTDKARKWHLAWSAAPVAVPQNLLHTYIP